MESAIILVVHDEREIRRTLRSILSSNGYDVIEATSAPRAIEMVSRERPHLILLDINMPHTTAMDACSKIRLSFAGPIIMLSGRKSEHHKITALDAGADDYIVKPFAMGELLAHLRAALRRVGSAGRRPDIETPELRVDFEKRRIDVRGETVHLGPKEFDVLRILINQHGGPITHRKILETIWGPEHTQQIDNLRVLINELRKKIEKDPAHPRYILTEHTFGYRFQLPTILSRKQSRKL
jgi:two-component system KDP operon response regulator KdpE